MEHGMANDTQAMQQFKEIFMDDGRRQDGAEWRAFFISETFLEAQFEEQFVQSMHEFLQRQEIVPYTKLPEGLVVELAIVYAWPERESAAHGVECDVVADIWNHQEERGKNCSKLQEKASFIRKKAYREYQTMREVVLNNTWNYRHSGDDMEEYKYTLSMASWHFIADDDKVNSMDIDDIRLEDDITHACEVELYDYLLRRYGFPVEACAYMYKYFELEDIETTEYADVYRNLKAHILEQYPDMNAYCKSNITAKDYADELREQLKALQEKYKGLGWGKNFDELYPACYATEVVAWCEEEAAQVYAIVNSALFQRYWCEEPVLKQLIISEFTVTQAKIFYEIYNKPEVFREDGRIIRLVHQLFYRKSGYGRQAQSLPAQGYDYDLTVGSPDFWEYFLTVAAGDRSMPMEQDDSPIAWGFLYENQMMLPAYMERVYMPSVEWRLRFTNYDKARGRFGDARSHVLHIKEELTVTIVFHYHYVRYYVNAKEAFLPVFDVDSLFAHAAEDNTTFLLLLPITRIAYEERQRVYDRLMEFLPGLMRLPVSARYLAAMLSGDNASVHRLENVTSRLYIENLTDCYRLDRYQDRRQRLFHFHNKYGCWEYVGVEMLGNHFRDRIDKMLGWAKEEGWDMDSFKESDISLPYEVETRVHDVAGCKTKEKTGRLLELFQNKNQCNTQDKQLLSDNRVILVFGDRDRVQLRQHLTTGVITDGESEKKAYREHRYLDSSMEKLEKYAKKDRDLQWKGWMRLENFHTTIPVCMGASGSCYAYGVPYDKGTKAKDFAALFGKLICLDDLTQIIEYEVELRSEWS